MFINNMVLMHSPEGREKEKNRQTITKATSSEGREQMSGGREEISGG